MSPVTVQPAAVWAGAVRRGNRWLPACGLLLALAAAFLFAGERDYFHSLDIHDSFTGKNMALAENLSAERGLLFTTMWRRTDGTVAYKLYGRFPIGAFVLIKLAIAPFAGDSAAQLAAARALMLAFFCAAAALAYLALARLTGSRAVALGATLLAFSSHHLLDYRDVVSNEASVGLFAVMLVFHGMVLFHFSGEGGRFPQLAVKVCAALLLDWHVYGLLLPFLVFGAAAEAAAAWRGPRERRGRANGASAGAARPVAGRLGAVVLRVARGRSVLLGALALLFGAGVLGYNFAREHAALDGQRAVAELPSVRSMLRRTGLAENTGLAKAGSGGAEALEWSTFLRWQFHRVGVACLPVALAGGVELDEVALRASGASGKAWLFWPGVAATLGALAGLALFHRPRAPPALLAAALALAGFCWAFLVPGSTGSALHQFETIFHVGVPLCLFAAVLLGARRLGWRRVAGVGALAGVLVFALSAGVGLARRDQGDAQLQRSRLAEFDAIAKTIQGKTVHVAAHREEIRRRFVMNRSIMDFLTAGGFVHYPDTPEVAGAADSASFDFALAFERYDTPALLTPNHRFVFLYEAGGGLEAMRAAWRREYRRLRALAPVARGGGFDIHAVSGEDTGREAGEIVYSKAPCGLDDTEGRFYLRLAPAHANLAGRRPEFERRDHIFYNGNGVIFDGKCMMRVPLPRWPVAQVSTGQLHPAGAAASWRTAFRLDVDRLRGVLRALRREAPSARAAFDVYAPRRLRGGTLRYMREPCTLDDVRRRFFLHIVPAAAAVLPEARLRSGFANLDFDFGERGALVDGACVATVELPHYDIARVRTGQVAPGAPDQGGGEAWRVEFAPNGAPAER